MGVVEGKKKQVKSVIMETGDLRPVSKVENLRSIEPYHLIFSHRNARSETDTGMKQGQTMFRPCCGIIRRMRKYGRAEMKRLFESFTAANILHPLRSMTDLSCFLKRRSPLIVVSRAIDAICLISVIGNNSFCPGQGSTCNYIEAIGVPLK
jgi:hypothetical protein